MPSNQTINVPIAALRTLKRAATRRGQNPDTFLADLIEGGLANQARAPSTRSVDQPVALPVSRALAERIAARAHELDIEPDQLIREIVEQAATRTNRLEQREAMARLWLPRRVESLLVLGALCTVSVGAGAEVLDQYERHQKERRSIALRPTRPMTSVPTGAFVSGCPDQDETCTDDESPEQVSRVSKFEIDFTEVRVKDYALCVEAGACVPPPAIDGCHFDQPDAESLPVNCVTFAAAQKFCQWMDRRLPTDDEWEKAARGTDGRPWAWGEEAPECHFESYTRDASDRHPLVPSPVYGDGPCEHRFAGEPLIPTEERQWPADISPYGVEDLSGSVLEWTTGSFGPPLATIDGDPFMRSLRGGRTYRRHGNVPHTQHPLIGFRCARSLKAGSVHGAWNGDESR